MLYEEDLGLAGPSKKTSQWDVKESSVDSSMQSAALTDHIIPYPPVTDHQDREEARTVEDGGCDHDVHDIEGDSATFGADAIGNETESMDELFTNTKGYF